MTDDRFYLSQLQNEKELVFDSVRDTPIRQVPIFFFFFSKILKQRTHRDGWMDGWMTYDFTSFSIVFQSYQDDGRMIMKRCVQWNPVYD